MKWENLPVPDRPTRKLVEKAQRNKSHGETQSFFNPPRPTGLSEQLTIFFNLRVEKREQRKKKKTFF